MSTSPPIPKRSPGRPKSADPDHVPDLVVRDLNANDVAALEAERDRRAAALPEGARLSRNAVVVQLIREALAACRAAAATAPAPATAPSPAPAPAPAPAPSPSPAPTPAPAPTVQETIEARRAAGVEHPKVVMQRAAAARRAAAAAADDAFFATAAAAAQRALAARRAAEAEAAPATAPATTPKGSTP